MKKLMPNIKTLPTMKTGGSIKITSMHITSNGDKKK